MEDNQDSDNQESRFKRIKRHIKENKTTYLVGGVCLGAGYFLRKPQVVTVINEVAPAITPVFNNMPVFNNTINNGGHARKIVRCIETDELWPSMTKAAEEAGVSLTKMSQHLHGRKDHVNEMHYVIEALAA